MTEHVDAGWSVREFHGLDLGDERLNRRLLVLAELQHVDDLLDAASGVEQRLGGPTARTLHARGFARASKSQWPEAAADCEAAEVLRLMASHPSRSVVRTRRASSRALMSCLSCASIRRS